MRFSSMSLVSFLALTSSVLTAPIAKESGHAATSSALDIAEKRAYYYYSGPEEPAEVAKRAYYYYSGPEEPAENEKRAYYYYSGPEQPAVEE